MFGWHATRFGCVRVGAARQALPLLQGRRERLPQVWRANPTSSPISNIRSVICCAMLLVLGPSKQDLIRAIR